MVHGGGSRRGGGSGGGGGSRSAGNTVRQTIGSTGRSSASTTASRARSSAGRRGHGGGSRNISGTSASTTTAGSSSNGRRPGSTAISRTAGQTTTTSNSARQPGRDITGTSTATRSATSTSSSARRQAGRNISSSFSSSARTPSATRNGNPISSASTTSGTTRTSTSSYIRQPGSTATSATRTRTATSSSTTRQPGSNISPASTFRSNWNNNIRSSRSNVTTTSSTTTRHHGNYMQDNLEEPLLIRPRTTEDWELEDNCNCCHGCACLCCATTLAFLGCCGSPCLMALQAHRAKSTLPLLLVTLLLFGILIAMSGSTTLWTLNAGANRQVIPGFWTNTVDIKVEDAHTTVEVDAYAIPGKCPPLTGPRLQLHHHLDMTFGPGDYQYDYFHLNKGSKVQADLHQLKGTANVYMLRGPDKVSILEEDQHHDDEDWLDNLLDSALQKWTVQDSYDQVMAKFRANKNDVFTLVYDNPYTRSGHLLVDLWLDLTTYNLKGYNPICSDIALRGDCSLSNDNKWWSHHCLLVDSSSPYGEGEEITLRIVERRNYVLIGIVSLIPTVLAIAWEIYSCCKQRPRTWPNRVTTQQQENETDAPSTLSTLTTDPPTAPPQPSAPPASQDHNNEASSSAAIPIATAQIVELENAAADALAPVATCTVPVEPVPAPSNHSGKK